MIFVLKGPPNEAIERAEAAKRLGRGFLFPMGDNTWEEAGDIVSTVVESCHFVDVITSAYHVPRAYLTISKAFADAKRHPVLRVYGVGGTTQEQARSEAAKLRDAQAKGHALTWEDCT